jgi:hypothetical protein
MTGIGTEIWKGKKIGEKDGNSNRRERRKKGFGKKDRKGNLRE